MASEAKISVKFFVDKDENRVVFAEADKDFLDTLFSFLTLPLSTVIELIGDSSALESMTNVYESVRSLDNKQLETRACKNMLLRPLSAGAFRCEDLKLNIGDTNPRRFYHCSNKDCRTRTKVFISLVPDVPCSYCGQIMVGTNSWRKREEDSVCDEGGVFVKGGGPTFFIMDDLNVMSASVASTSTLLQKLCIRNKKKLEERILDLGKKEVSYLLKQSIISRTPLTDLCFPHKTEAFQNESRFKADTRNKTSIQREGQSGADLCEEISIKLYIDSDRKSMVCAEVDGEMANLLFGFLVLPIGSIIELLNDSSSMECLHNLYRSVECLGSEYMVSDECKSLLLSPKLSPFFSCCKSLLNVEELVPSERSSYQGPFPSVVVYDRVYPNGNKYVQPQLVHLNPKKKVATTGRGGGYANGRVKYILTDNLCVSPLTPTGILQAISDCEGTFSKILEREVVIGKVQALELLKAALISKTPLTDVFLPRAGEEDEHKPSPLSGEKKDDEDQIRPRRSTRQTKMSFGLVLSEI